MVSFNLLRRAGPNINHMETYTVHIVMAQSGTAMGAVVAGASAMVAPETALVRYYATT